MSAFVSRLLLHALVAADQLHLWRICLACLFTSNRLVVGERTEALYAVEEFLWISNHCSFMEPGIGLKAKIYFLEVGNCWKLEIPLVT